ncbi:MULTISPECIES: glycerophosphodiester phosphodiesterase family protein [Paenibacillus]|nr:MULTISPECIES: glycerophosphodiester phosphodiesterase family protein [Paenibacillus]
MWIIVALLSGMLQLSVLPEQAQAADAGRKTLDVNKTRHAPVIDGKLDESIWSINERLDRRIGEGGFQESRFGLLWDNRYLYIGVKSDDANLIHNGSGYWFEQDGVNIFLDPTQHQSAPFAEGDMQIGLMYQPGTTTPKLQFGAALSNHSGKDEKKILRAIQTTASGWSLEVAVPWDMLHFDPMLNKRLGLEIGTTDRYGDDTSQQRTSYWSAYNSSSFWNDTSGYGVVTLVDGSPVSGDVNPVLLQEHFDGYAAGSLPPGWISDVNSGSSPFTVVQDTYGNGRMLFDGKASGKQARVIAPIQWDNYEIEADMRFEGVVNAQRWAALMFRVPSNGKVPYDQMAVRQNGTYEMAYRKPDGNWFSPTPISGMWKPLTLNEDYTLKVRVFGNNVKEYIKAKTDADFTLLTDQTLGSDVLLEKGKIGFQADQSKVSFDNLKVTRITADNLYMTLPPTMEALSGAVNVTASVYYSDGITEAVPSGMLKLYTSDESVIKIVNNQINPLKPGKAKVTAIYADAEWSQEITVTPSAVGAKVVSLQHESGYVLSAAAGQPIELDSITLRADYSDFTSGLMKGSEVNWTSVDPAVVIHSGTMKVQQKGVYTVTAEKDGVQVSIRVVAKNAGDSDYVLYEENFDALANGTLPQGWTRKQGTTAGAAAVNNGAFEIDASAAPDNPSRVLLPDYLGAFGNYKIEADITHLAANNTARWNSIMYRIQNDNYPYYQMAVRQDATAANGVEFAERTPANGWNVMEKGSYTEAINPNKLYHYTILAYGNRVQEWIGSQLVIDTDRATSYAKGRIGLQADGSKMKVDNIRVTLLQTPLPAIVDPSDRFVQVTEPDTKIAMAPTVVAEITSLENLAGFTGPTLPATVILHVNGDLKVTNPTGEKEIGSLDSVLGTIGTRMIPAFYVKDELSVERLTEYLKSIGLEDAFVVSNNGDLIKKARTAYPIIRGIVDFTSETNGSEDRLIDIRRQTTASLAKIALLPQSAATPDNVNYLQQRMVSIWTKETANAADESIAMHRLITAGVNGIVTDSPDKAFDAFKVYTHDLTLIRKPYMIGHRGLPTKAPENTIESNLLAIQAGADFIENDMYLSKDGHLVIVHDTDLTRTTNGSGNAENYTLAELKALNANKPMPAGYPDVKIPTLEEQIDLAKAHGRMIMAEIKTSTPNAVGTYVRVIREQDAEALIDTMSFHASQLKLMAQLMPEMPLGLLVSAGTVKQADTQKSLRDALMLVQPLNATFNTGYDRELNKNFLEAAKHRGLIVSPWTYNNKNDFINIFKSGVYGITTDYADWASDWAAALKPVNDKFVLQQNETIPLSSYIVTFKGEQKDVQPDIVLLDGLDTVEANGSMLTAKKPGRAHALLRYSFVIDDNNKYDLYTQPVLIHVESHNADLAGLEVSAGTLTPAFAPDTTAYQWTVGRSVSTIRVTPTAADAWATLKVNGVPTVSGAVYEAALKYGTNRIAIQVTADDNTTTKEYVLSVLRPQPDDESSGGTSSPAPSAGAPSTGDGIRDKEEDGRKIAQTTVDDAAIRAAVNRAGQGSITLQAVEEGEDIDQAMISLTPSALQVLQSQQAGSTVVFKTNLGAWQLPLEQIDVRAWATRLEVSPDKLHVTVQMTKDDKAKSAAEANGLQVLASIEFKLTAAAENGSSSEISSFSRYVPRTMKLNGPVNEQTLAAVRVETDANGNTVYQPVPFALADGEAVLYSRSNSTYMLLDRRVTFSDLSGHWAKQDVERMAAKWIVQGVDDDKFAPDREVTRAEFAALLVRSLGLAAAAPAGATFKDVKPGDWFASAVNTAAANGLVTGYEDDTFRPYGYISRQEMAVMIYRTMQFAGYRAADPAAGNASFSDESVIAAWAREATAKLAGLQMVNGVSANRFAPESTGTRAESAVLLSRMLRSIDFSN